MLWPDESGIQGASQRLAGLIHLVGESEGAFEQR
jgi:hypothetical protein